MLLIDKTFEIVTNESAEHGEVEDAGFSAIGEKYTFRELVLILKGLYVHPSQSPANRSTHVWFTSESEQTIRLVTIVVNLSTLALTILVARLNTGSRLCSWPG
jgi:hypothetical protein